MSADSTELTFVRCPSCRSLVPAVSTRCRMCGATIDAQGKETPPEETAAPRRARQHTITQPSTEFIKAVDSVKKSPGAEAPSDAEEFDPLRDFMDAADEQPAVRPAVAEVAPTAAPVVPEPTSAPSSIATEADDDDFDIFADDEDDDWLDDLIDEPKSAPEKVEAKQDIFDDPFPQTEEVVAKPAEVIKPVNGSAQTAHRGETASHAPAAPVTREVPKVVVESGNRPAGKNSPFSFSKGKGESTQNPRETRTQVSVVPKGGNPAVQGNRPKDQRPAERGPQRPDNRSSQPLGKSEDRHGNKGTQTTHHAKPQSTQVPPQRPPQQHRTEPHRGASTVHTKPVVRPDARRDRTPEVAGEEARLVGWFVSFSTPKRTSFELREGKFFISGASLKPNDLVLDDPSISTPHAIVAVDSGRLQIQDLMSEGGVLRRRSGEQDFVLCTEPFELVHGDWVRFGNVDFLVTMIPSEFDS